MDLERRHQNSLGRFVDFVSVHQQGPSPNRIFSVDMEGPDSLEARIKSAWDEYGEDYLRAETVGTHIATMAAILLNVQEPEKWERWLSLGSGPGLYEAFLAQSLRRIKIDSLDLSSVLLRKQKEILDWLAAREGRVARRVSPVNGSMIDLPLSDGIYNQILNINSLQWATDWRKAISEMNRVLSPEDKARVFVVGASAPRINKEGRMIGSLADDLDTDTLLDELENYGLMTKVMGYLKIDRAQLGIPTVRFYCLSERGFPVNDWRSRIKGLEIPVIDYEIIGGRLNIIDYTPSLHSAS